MCIRDRYKVFAENFPIADTRNNFVLEFLDYYIDPPHYSIDECLERGDVYKRQALSSVTTTVPAEPVKPDIHLRAYQCLGIYSPEWLSLIHI